MARVQAHHLGPQGFKIYGGFVREGGGRFETAVHDIDMAMPADWKLDAAGQSVIAAAQTYKWKFIGENPAGSKVKDLYFSWHEDYVHKVIIQTRYGSSVCEYTVIEQKYQ
jgi:hypothetical protein